MVQLSTLRLIKVKTFPKYGTSQILGGGPRHSSFTWRWNNETLILSYRWHLGVTIHPMISHQKAQQIRLISP